MSFSKFELSADAPAFVPAAAGGGGGAAAAAPAAAQPVDATRNLTFETYGVAAGTSIRKRTFNIRPMAVVRTDGLTTGHGPFNSIGSVFHGYSHDSDADSLDSEDEAVQVGCHDNDYRLKKIVRPMPGVAAADVGDFPNNIAEYYWINDGKNDEYPWYVLGRLNNGTYFYFAASCGFSGFECEGQMHLYAADNIQALYDHGMCGAARLRFASCFDKGTREKIKADAMAAKAARTAQAAKRFAVAKQRAGTGARAGAGAGAAAAGKRR